MSNKKRIQVKVLAGSKEDRVLGFEGEVLKVRCKAPKEKGKANEAVCSLIARYFEIPKACVCLVHGQSSSLKLFEVSIPEKA